MPLTITQAQQAGTLAAQAAALQGYIAQLQAAIGAGVVLEQITCIASAGPPLEAAMPLSVQDTATLLTSALTIYQNMLTAVTAQLQAMGS